MPRLAINLASAADRFRGGTGTFVDGLLDGLARMGDAAEVVIVASPAAAARGVWSRPGTAWRQEIVVDPAASSFGFASLGDRGAIASLVQRLGIDVWFTPHTLPAPPVLPCATLGAILDVQHEDLPELYAPRERARRALVYETIARTCTRVVTLSAFSRDRIAARYAVDPDRLDVVPPAPPAWPQGLPSRPHPSGVLGAGRPSPPYVLYPATTWHHKNHVTLIDALALLRDRGRSLGLVLTGLEGQAHPDVLVRIADRGLAGSVTWLGHVDEGRLCTLFDGAAVVAVPSRYEGFGLPVLEAMMRGVPAVIADAASLPEVAGDAAVRVPALDASAWADALWRVATDPSLRDRLRAAGLARAGAFSLDVTAARLWASVSAAAAAGPRAVPAPRHAGPDRSFRGCCRYYLQAPSAGTLEVRGTAGEAANWTMTCTITPDVGSAVHDVREGSGAFDGSWSVTTAPASLALAIDTRGSSATLARLAVRLTDGVELDVLPSMTIGGPEETLDESLARAVVRLNALAGRGVRRVALYGAGSHSRLLVAHLAGGPCRVVGVIDDGPGAERFEDLPLVTPDAWTTLAADALVLSSRGSEAALAARASAWLPAGVPMVRLYTDEGRS